MTIVDPINGEGTGRYEVRGHFDDPQAKACSPIPFGVTVTTPPVRPKQRPCSPVVGTFVVTVATTLG